MLDSSIVAEVSGEPPMGHVVEVSARGSTRIVTLNRPEVLNAVNRKLRSELTKAIVASEQDANVAAVVITGAGKAFCAGQDIAESISYELSELRAWCDGMRAMYQSVRQLSKPCVVAWHGVAAGAGMQIGLCADLRITHATARIGQPEVKAGLASIVGSWMLEHYVGHGINAELSLAGGLVSGERAVQIGIASKLVEEAQVVEAALAASEELLRIPRVAFRLTKQRFREVSQPGFDAATAAGVRATYEAYATGEPQRVMKAFVEERARRKRTR
jgi:enoyl-CoA hydratase/carnithine racemase